MPEPLLMDTHVWVWLMEGSDELAAEQADWLDQAGRSGMLSVSVISVWEIATLVSKGRLSFPLSVSCWVDRALSQPGLQLRALTPAICVESAELPGFHGDPADRILVATARIEDTVLVTRDSRILEWSRTGRVRAHRA